MVLDLRSSLWLADWLLVARGEPGGLPDAEEGRVLDALSSFGDCLMGSVNNGAGFDRDGASTVSWPPVERLRDSFGFAAGTTLSLPKSEAARTSRPFSLALVVSVSVLSPSAERFGLSC